MTAKTPRKELIQRHLGVSAPLSSVASDLNDRFQEALADCNDLSSVEQARLLSELMVQISGKLARLVN